MNKMCSLRVRGEIIFNDPEGLKNPLFWTAIRYGVTTETGSGK